MRIVPVLALAACAPTQLAAEEPPNHECIEMNDVTFSASPGGVPEVRARWLAEHGCNVRIVDVREDTEATEIVPDAEVIPLGHLAEAARVWAREEPVVLVCRSGRRSARAVTQLESLGFNNVASMTGGMLMWNALELPTEGRSPAEPAPTIEWPVRRDAVSAAEVHTLLASTHVPRVRVASLLLGSSEACVDGREEGAVLGTPGGDAGELLLALSTIESLSGHRPTERETRELFNAYVESFGRFYMHTDEHALESLAAALRRDERFGNVPLASIEEVEALVRNPPTPVVDELLEYLARPSNIGCGHLKLISLHPDEYGVSTELTRQLLQVVYRKLWRRPEAVHFVVLRGEHAERAVLNVRMRNDVYAFTNVPAIPPRMHGISFFVNHPQVSTFIRAQHARFIFENASWLEGVSHDELAAAVNERAERQLTATLEHLAARLPIFEVVFDGEVVTVSAR